MMLRFLSKVVVGGPLGFLELILNSSLFYNTNACESRVRRKWDRSDCTGGDCMWIEKYKLFIVQDKKGT